MVQLLVAGAALLLGLAGTPLHTGWIDPLDWMLPGAVAIVLILLLASRRGGPARRLEIVLCWALAAMPAMVFCLLAGPGRPWLATALLGAGLALVTVGSAQALSLRPTARGLAMVALLGGAALAPHGMTAWSGVKNAPMDRPAIGVMAAIPLQGVPLGAAQGLAPAEAIGLRSPLWQMLEARFRPMALDALDAGGLSGLDALLLIQPRRLAPVELVALDGWVRGGGRAVILADPLLHWPDHRPLAHPARAPLTSLLDPLLSHWGLRLEPAGPASGDDAVERRWLSTGGLMQLSGASRFTAQTGGDEAAACVLRDEGLVAHCRVGRGMALLVADADWIADPLWTLDPQDPENRGAWTSDSVDLLDGWLRGVLPRFAWHGTWLADRAALLQSLRFALALLLALAMVAGLVARRPTPSRSNFETKQDQKRNKSETKVDLA
ncbi:MAG TPA: hypothetical protein VNS79_06865 [Sphingobium sp.]|nr:hypothetical protein [Sphingobium sp.]